MNIYRFDNDLLNKPIVLALGLFDTIHLAHRHLIRQTIEVAKKLDAYSAILTFSNNPKRFFKDKFENMVYDFETRCEILQKLNLDYLFHQTFDNEFANLSPNDFLDRLLRYNLKAIVCGFDYSFGKDAFGNVETLKAFCHKNKIELVIIDKIFYNDIKLSSTAISNYLLKGDIISANNLLGESYRYTGVVSHGHAVGRNLGFATANIPIKDDIIILKDGVYIGYCEFDNKRYKTMINVGSRITFNDIERKIEAHILDFNDVIYGKKITLFFEKYLRSQKKFASQDELMLQLANDEKITRMIL